MIKSVCSTPCLKNVTPLACYNFDTLERILIFFGRNVIDKVSNQKMLCYGTSNNFSFCTTTWQNWETWKLYFSLKCCCIRASPEYNSTSRCWFLQSFSLTTHTHAAVWLPKSCNQYVQLRAVRGHDSGERKPKALQQLDCVTCTMHQCAVFWVSSYAR